MKPASPATRTVNITNEHQLLRLTSYPRYFSTVHSVCVFKAQHKIQRLLGFNTFRCISAANARCLARHSIVFVNSLAHLPHCHSSVKHVNQKSSSVRGTVTVHSTTCTLFFKRSYKLNFERGTVPVAFNWTNKE